MGDERYHVTTSLRCNNRCVFCMEGDHSGEDLRRDLKRFKTEFLTKAQLKRQLGRLPDKGVPLLFTGGEPTINPKILELAAFARDRGFRRIAVQTNGRMLSSAPFLLRLIRAGVRDFSVSIHGSVRLVHDGATRVRGSFEQTRRGLENLLEAKRRLKTLRVSTNTTISRINLDDLPALLRLLLRRPGVDTVVLNPVIFQRNAVRHMRRIAVRYSEAAAAVRGALRSLRRSRVPRLDRIRLIDMPACAARGLEGFLGDFEPVLLVDSEGGVDALGAKQDFPGRKRPRCGACSRFRACTGVSPEYVRKYGWKEFVPC